MEEKEIVTREKREKQEVQGQEKTRPGRYFIPDVDICEFADRIVLWADMPGVTEKDVDVTVRDHALRITGAVSPGMYDKLSPLYTEYNVGNYVREFELNQDVNEAAIKARMRNGVLEVELPKAEAAKPRKITVQAT